MILPEKRKYLNLGCGNRYFPEWINIDFSSRDQNIYNYNILKGLPFQDNEIEVIYCSHLLEHLKLEEAMNLLSECHRALKNDGILRLVVPDLQNIVNQYITLINELEENDSEEIYLKHNWSIIELLDQSTRNFSGGQMKMFIESDGENIKEFIINRLGYTGIELFKKEKNNKKRVPDKRSLSNKFRNRLLKLLMTREEKEDLQIGNFRRRSGEIHYWMYDKYSIKRVLLKAGFKSIEFLTPGRSKIPDWNLRNLDILDEISLHNSSLYTEAIN
jgi:predicted SAM-dependent methyltransferase